MGADLNEQLSPIRTVEMDRERRAEIDGLRAIAIGSVLLFHFGLSGFGGGFVGVDIFFVISGFLISRILIEDFQHGRFSLPRFYERRVRRLLPALVVTIALTLAAGFFTMTPSDYERLGTEALAAIFFFSNILFFQQVGYFDTAAEFKPLLHTWSLAVEEQFYLLWPLVIWAASRFRLVPAAILASGAMGVVLLVVFRNDTSATFYLVQFRIVEFAVGAAVLFIPRPGRAIAEAATVIGLVAIVASVIFMPVGTKTIYMIVPCIGAALVILGGASRPSLLLRLPPSIFIGRISYSLYLIHWPVCSLLLIVLVRKLTLPETIAVILAMFVFSALMWRYVERPFIERKVSLRPLAFGLAGIIALAATIVLSMGLPFRMADQEKFAAFFENSKPDWSYMEREGILEHYRNDCNFYNLDEYRILAATNIPHASIDESCTFAPAGKKTLFLWGDSHVEQFYYGLLNELPDDWQILIVSSSSCSAKIEEQDSDADYCVRSNWYALNSIRQLKPNVVLIAQRAGHEPATMNGLASELERAGVGSVLFAGPVPRWTTPLFTLIMTRMWAHTPLRTDLGLEREPFDVDEKLKAEQLTMPATYISLTDILCNEEGCLTRTGPDRMLDIVMWDDSHLTLSGSIWVAKNGLAAAVMNAYDE